MEKNGISGEADLLRADALGAMCPADDELLELVTRGASRVFIPMKDWRVRLSGSQLYPALSWKGRAYRAALRAWVTTGGARATHRLKARRGGGWPLGGLLRPDLPALSTAAVSVGPPVRGQKATAQVMDGRGRVLGFAKYGDNALTRTRILNEAKMLGALPEGVGPRLIRHAPLLDGDVLVQTPVPGRARTPRLELDRPQMHLLGRLVRPGQAYAASEHPYVVDLGARAGGRGDLLEPVVADLEEGRWPLAFLHGDLAPWNMRWWRGRYTAFDWEYGTPDGFPYVDAAYTLIQVANFVRRVEARQAKRLIAERLGARLPAPYARHAASIADLAALHTLVGWYPPREPLSSDPEPFEDWLERFVRANP